MKGHFMIYQRNGLITQVHFNGETYWVERRLPGQAPKTGEEIGCDLELEEAQELAQAKLSEF
jgi:hypothetical protein